MSPYLYNINNLAAYWRFRASPACPNINDINALAVLTTSLVNLWFRLKKAGKKLCDPYETKPLIFLRY